MVFNWTREKTTILIQLWEKHPELYVITTRDYRNKFKKIEATKNICEEFEAITGDKLTPDDIAKKMHGLKTQYQREKSKENKSKTSGCSSEDIYIPKLWAYPLLGFLADTVAATASLDNLASTSKSTPQSEDSMDLIFDGTLRDLEETTDIEFTTPEPTTPDSEVLVDTPVPEKKRKRGNATVVDDFMQSAKASLLELAKPIVIPTTSTNDEISTFVMNMDSELRLVKSKKRIRAVKAKILNLIYEAQEEKDSFFGD